MEFPGLGENCAHPTCNQLDFLPMKCDSCRQTFCNNHFRYEYHQCEGGRRRDVQVPTCPLCSAPVPGKRGEEPDIAVSEHIDNDCQADPAKERRKKIFTNKCSLKGCKNKEMVPLVCAECTSNFCFRHRHAADHKCIGKMAAIKKRSEEAALSRLKTRQNIISNNSQTNPVNTSRLLSEVQGNMSEDEALARALALSLENESPETNTNSGRSMAMNQQRQRVGGDQNGRCIVS